MNLTTGLAYRPYSGLLASLTYGNGLTEQNTFTLDYELSRLLVNDGAVALIDRQHNRTDLLNLTGIADAVTPANSATFSYSPANRLATAAGPWGSLSWTYDGVGNRLAETLGAASQTYSYPVANNKLSAISGTPSRAFTYDANGNILTDVRAGVTYAYTYNNANRLKTVTVAGNLKATYTYSALEQLAIRVLTNSTPSGTIHSIYDLDGNLIVEANDLGETVREYVWNPRSDRPSVARA